MMCGNPSGQFWGKTDDLGWKILSTLFSVPLAFPPCKRNLFIYSHAQVSTPVQQMDLLIYHLVYPDLHVSHLTVPWPHNQAVACPVFCTKITTSFSIRADKLVTACGPIYWQGFPVLCLWGLFPKLLEHSHDMGFFCFLFLVWYLCANLIHLKNKLKFSLLFSWICGFACSTQVYSSGGRL